MQSQGTYLFLKSNSLILFINSNKKIFFDSFSLKFKWGVREETKKYVLKDQLKIKSLPKNALMKFYLNIKIDIKNG